MVVVIFGQLIMFLAPTSFPLVMTGTIIKTIGASPSVGTLFAVVADTVGYCEWKFGLRTDGLAYGALGLALKSCVGFGGVLVGGVLAWGGYVAGAPAQSPAALFAIKTLFLLSLDRRYPSILKDLNASRRSG